jgi:hypothetical protein
MMPLSFSVLSPAPSLPLSPYLRYAVALCAAASSSQIEVADLAACCTAASTPQSNPWGGGSDPSQSYTYFENKTCALYHFAFSGMPCEGAISGVMPPPPPPPPGTPGADCTCKRVNQTVGREPLGSPGGGGNMGGNNAAGGTWFSYPAMGECKPHAEVGDSSGCAWKAVG